MRTFSLSEFTPDEIARAKYFVRSAIKGILRIKLKTMVDEQFEKLSRFNFTGDDTLHFTIELNTIANDFLAALGCARNSIQKRGPGRGCGDGSAFRKYQKNHAS